MWLALLLGLFLALYLYVKKKMTYFEKLGIPHQPGTFPCGSDVMWKVFSQKVAFAKIADVLSEEFPEAKIVGYYGFFGTPTIVITDFELMKKVMIKDFEYFTDRRPLTLHPDTNKYLTKMMTTQTGQEWKNNRSMMSPIFTSGKLKQIMPTIDECSDDYLEHLQKIDKTDLDVKKLMNLCTCEILGRIGCGVKPDIFKDPDNNVFYQQMLKLIGQSGGKFRMLKVMLVMFLPSWIGYYTKISFIPQETSDFFVKIIRNATKSRRDSDTKQGDFIDFWVEMFKNLEKNNKLEEAEIESEFEKNAQVKGEAPKHMTPEEIDTMVVANGLLVFFVGNDTTSTAMAIVLFFLANYPDVQEKVYEEIQNAIDENGGKEQLDYNALHGLSYMEKVVKECFRCWGVSFLERLCVKDYHIPELNVTIPKDMMVQLAGNKIHQNEENYPNPSEFDPDLHFDTDVLMPSTFLTFGQGPRNCIGMRFAWTIMRSFLVRLLANYKVLPGPGLEKTMVIDPASPQGLPKNGVHVKLEERQK